MKKLIILLTVILLLILLMVVLNFHIKKDLLNDRQEAYSYWIEFVELKNRKNDFIQNYITLANKKHSENDSIVFFLKKKDKGYLNKTDSINILAYQEYNINDFFLRNYRNLKEVDSINRLMNEIVDKYNESVDLFNRKRSLFPNFIVARKYGLDYLKHFKIVYGKKNKNPKEKTNIEKWIKTGDPKYLEDI